MITAIVLSGEGTHGDFEVGALKYLEPILKLFFCR